MVFRLFRQKEKTQQALAKTRRGWGGGLLDMFRRHREITDELWDELEEALVAADVGVETSLNLVKSVRTRVREEGARDDDDLVEIFKEEVTFFLEGTPEQAKAASAVWRWYEQENLPVKPFVLLVVGVNGVGKTTSIAKMANHYAKMGKKVVIGAGDTFRAAAVEQLRVWGDRLGVDVIAHQQGADPAAVAFDAYQAAVARGADVLIFDTAGRLHTKGPLIEELRKVHRVFERQSADLPHQVLLVLDATTGHNGLEQARVFKEAVGVDGVFLAKLDGTAKGGIVVAIAQELRLPVVFIGTGEGLDDLSLFNTDDFVDALFGDREAAA
ncbi:MAG: signal recognition particle-docking protein FtsY [SAR202 cluster bacterium]|nr:signal recognition particle-docking protein FtsY [SAR202 cluster bacterium]